ncbi:MarR family winged helix-turn-helix transcriptional regulator [Chloroflexota bacterium]
MDKATLIKQIIQLQQRMFNSMVQHTPEAWMDISLTIDQLKSLLFIDFQGSTNFKMLATALRVTPPNVTGIIDRLLGQGLVSREENPENRRMMILKTTDKGKTLLAKLKESKTGQMSSILDKLTLEELSVLAEGLGAVARVIKQENKQEK